MIFRYAFQPQAIIGGGFGYAIKTAISQGAKRGLFSNEAGMGSTPHAHALANVDCPHDQGVVAMIGVFILANLAVGFTFSTLARNQLQAMQMTFFFFLPSILLSGFMFPFRGMPGWAQTLGEVLPLTHFLRIVRGILLKGNGIDMIWPHTWPILLFTGAVLAFGLKTFRKTLD